MIKVRLSGPLAVAAGNPGTIEMEAGSMQEVIAQLRESYPRLRASLDKGVSVAINGEMHRRAGFQRIEPGSEVHLLMPLAGG